MRMIIPFIINYYYSLLYTTTITTIRAGATLGLVPTTEYIRFQAIKSI